MSSWSHACRDRNCAPLSGRLPLAIYLGGDGGRGGVGGSRNEEGKGDRVSVIGAVVWMGGMICSSTHRYIHMYVSIH